MSIFDSIKRFFGGSAPPSGGNGASAPAGTDEEMIPCEEALRRVHEYLDGELEGVPAAQVKRHFEVCGRCYPHLKLESAYREAVRRAGAGQGAPPELRRKVLALLSEARSED
ncbi:MAG: zf-HC2 domain-containing protein [Longimicrobiales bacterium]|nr:zf-HC2 domain-containing protein [Longimicrobiales bacterium]